MDSQQAIRILKDVQYKDGWSFFVSGAPDFYLQVRLTDAEGKKYTGRKWRLSNFMTRSELVQTALGAILACEEHETREAFRWRGRAIFGPHFDVHALWLASEYKEVRT